jgi:hypothetical protein
VLRSKKIFFEWSFSLETFDLLPLPRKSDRREKREKVFSFFTGKVKKGTAGENDQINILIRGITNKSIGRVSSSFFPFPSHYFGPILWKVCTGYKLG